ncbi:MAG TPA: ABC transporter ATP-binding protein [Bryobacteraceae bacterium]|nr:ABC transporter ATP-binding protein [Bryobacteraceae bacterium]
MISLRSLTKTYQTPAGKFSALLDVNLDVGAGEFIAVAGKSGSGKSTLLNMIGGIDTPSAGTVTVSGADVHKMDQNALASWRGRTVGFVFQFFQLLPTLTAAENVLLPMDFAGILPPGQRRKRALDLLHRFGVAPQADKLPSALSGGEQQRVAIARALANDPPLVLADEPTGNLDSVTADAVLGLFRQMATAGATVVIATHERDIARIVDRTVHMTDGGVR